MNALLPIHDLYPELQKAMVLNNTLILQAPPGAGKSTILPLLLLKESFLNGKKILMLEPRRLAAKAVAKRMSDLLGEPLGKTVGFRVRFETAVSSHTKIEVVTEGILTRMLQQDQSLEGIGLVIFDEFHERSLQADLTLALTRESQQVLREDLKIMIMSATLDGEKLSSLLNNAPILTSEGRQFPIRLQYFNPDPNQALPLQIAKLILKGLKDEQGDLLVFLPGVGEIKKTLSILEQESLGVLLLPLYGDLTFAKQQEAILPNPTGKRKVVLTTSIAETSLTIEGITLVIDSGVSRIPKFESKTGLTSLTTVKVSKDAADQRAGRAGRLREGVCYRFWSEGSHQYLQDHRTPEILEADLTPMVLELAQWGVISPSSLTWLTAPPQANILQANETLQLLGATEKGKITTKGKAMLQFPTHPRIAQLLLMGKEINQAALASDLAAVLEERDPLPKEAGVNIANRIEALRKYRQKEYVRADTTILERIERLARAWRTLLQCTAENQLPNYEQVGKLLASAYPERIALQQEKDPHRYRLRNGKIAKIEHHDALVHEKWISIAHLDAGHSEGKIFLASPINPRDVLPMTEAKESIRWDSYKGLLVAQREQKLGEITVSSSPLELISETNRYLILFEVIRKEGVLLFNWTDALIQWQARVIACKTWQPENDWPEVSTSWLIEHPESWATGHLDAIKKREDFKKLDVVAMISTLLPWDKHQPLEKLAPTSISVPSGSMIPINYNIDGAKPVLAVRLQEVFGLLDTPKINEGKITLMLQLLSPGYKPVQVTQDLKSFWQNTYSDVRKELRMRYPKHHWPEDPWTAEAVRGVRRKG